MLSIIKSISLHGIEGYFVQVEVDVSKGLPYFEVIGLPDASVKEAKERVRAAILNSGYRFESRKILVNLSPASTKKEGSFLDLPIAVGILEAMGEIQAKDLASYLFLGELSLDGKVKPVKGILPICMEASRLGIENIMLPKENATEAAILPKIKVYPVEELREVVEHVNQKKKIRRQDTTKIEIPENAEGEIDFAEVKGQEQVKRALEIAASGGHNCLLIGSPGTRKDYVSQTISYHFTKTRLGRSDGNHQDL